MDHHLKKHRKDHSFMDIKRMYFIVIKGGVL